ncbi:hypothetical protein CFP56_030059 [Quercus suber]|uniref:Uncharacterized protein n=1 Tax=Quercus suber TaxID=58331 RepID=A0AAW0JP46_QUESU
MYLSCSMRSKIMRINKNRNIWDIKGCIQSTQNREKKLAYVLSDSDNKAATIAKCTVAVLGAAITICGLLYGSSGSKTNRKTMKAPARNHRIFRDDFERDPAAYFRNLRK